MSAPSVALSIACAALWLVLGGRTEGRPRARQACLAAAALVLLGLADMTVEARRWHSDATLWAHTLTCNPDSFVALDGMGQQLQRERRERAVRLGFGPAWYNRAETLLALHRVEEAPRTTIALWRASPGSSGRASGGRTRSRSACRGDQRIRSSDRAAPEANGALQPPRRCTCGSGASPLGARDFRRALAIEPGFALAHGNLGSTWLRLGDLEAARAAYARAAALGYPEAEHALRQLDLGAAGAARP